MLVNVVQVWEQWCVMDLQMITFFFSVLMHVYYSAAAMITFLKLNSCVHYNWFHTNNALVLIAQVLIECTSLIQ